MWDEMIVGGLTTTKAEFNAGFPLAEQMRDSFLTLISRRAGSSADCDCLRITAGKETAAVPRVQGSLHIRALTPKRTERNGEDWECHQGHGGEGTRVRVERSGGMGKSPQRWI